MTDRDTGGPAFPFWSPGTSPDSQQTGMTLRDYFAGQVLPTVLTVCVNDKIDPETGYPAHVAKQAYRVADAMLKESGQ